jgi:hypothetical protein
VLAVSFVCLRVPVCVCKVWAHAAINIVKSSVADPDPSDPYVLGFLDPDLLVRDTDPDTDPSIIKQN